MDLRICGSKTLRRAQGGDCLFISFDSDQTKSPTQISFREIGIEFDGLRKSWNRLVAFLITPRKFFQNVVGAGIVRVNLDFFEEFLLRTFRRIRPGIRTRKQHSAQQEVNAATPVSLYFPEPLTHWICAPIRF